MRTMALRNRMSSESLGATKGLESTNLADNRSDPRRSIAGMMSG